MSGHELNRYSIALRDFEKAAEYAERAAEHVANTLEYEALVFAAIVSYWRPFSSNEKPGTNAPAISRLTLDSFGVLSEEDKNLHTECKELRNRGLAHSEWKLNPTQLDAKFGVISSRPFSLLVNTPDLQALAQLARHLVNECHHKRADLVKRHTVGQTWKTDLAK